MNEYLLDKHWMLDRDDGRNEVDFPRAIDLVTFIKSYYGDYFAIGVAAYPDTHPQSKDVDEDIRFLKEKVGNVTKLTNSRKSI